MRSGLTRPFLLVILGGLAVIAIFGGVVLFNSFGPPPPTIDPPPVIPPVVNGNGLPSVDVADELKLAVERHFEKFEAKNFREQTDGLLSDYENSGDTVVEWTRQAGIYAGTYRGFNSLTILYAQVLGNTESINITITNYEAQFSEAGAITTMHLLNLGQGKIIGEFTMEIDVSMDWIFDEEGSRWLITGETWEFVVFKTEVIAEGTVFPLHWQKRGDFSIWDEGMRQLFPSP